jgi:hypothetical protein
MSEPENDYVCGTEILYRSVPNQRGTSYLPISGGGHCVSKAAFEDRRKQQPSVDRAKLRGNPEASKRSSDALVVSLTTDRVRGIEWSSAVDVRANPNPPEDPHNDAHALIVAQQPFASKGEFNRFKQALAIVANSNWEIAPSDPV